MVADCECAPTERVGRGLGGSYLAWIAAVNLLGCVIGGWRALKKYRLGLQDAVTGKWHVRVLKWEISL